MPGSGPDLRLRSLPSSPTRRRKDSRTLFPKEAAPLEDLPVPSVPEKGTVEFPSQKKQESWLSKLRIGLTPFDWDILLASTCLKLLLYPA